VRFDATAPFPVESVIGIEEIETSPAEPLCVAASITVAIVAPFCPEDGFPAWVVVTVTMFDWAEATPAVAKSENATAPINFFAFIYFM